MHCFAAAVLSSPGLDLSTMLPTSCDTFVALPPSTEGPRVVFGKNSDRPSDEVQEVVYFPAKDYAPGDKLEVSKQCDAFGFNCFYLFVSQ